LHEGVPILLRYLDLPGVLAASAQDEGHYNDCGQAFHGGFSYATEIDGLTANPHLPDLAAGRLV